MDPALAIAIPPTLPISVRDEILRFAASRDVPCGQPRDKPPCFPAVEKDCRSVHLGRQPAPRIEDTEKAMRRNADISFFSSRFHHPEPDPALIAVKFQLFGMLRCVLSSAKKLDWLNKLSAEERRALTWIKVEKSRTFGPECTREKGVTFASRIIVDIGINAPSKGISDPTTAVA